MKSKACFSRFWSLLILCNVSFFLFVDSFLNRSSRNDSVSASPFASEKTIQKCPKLDVLSSGYWSSNSIKNKRTWTWTTQHGKRFDTSNQANASKRNFLSTLLKRKNTSLVLYGSSHLRELYKSLIRLEQGLPSDAELPHEITNLPSGSRFQSKECDPTRRGWITGLLGVDLDKCGLPGRRRVPELGERVAIGFKTFLHTPDADGQFLDFLSENDLRWPSVLIVDVGIWGARGNKFGGTVDYELSPEAEVSYYINWIQTSFPNSKIVFLVEELSSFPVIQKSLLETILGLTENSDSIFVLRKDYLMKGKPRQMPCAHGCAGPLMNTAALIFLEWLDNSISLSNCIR